MNSNPIIELIIHENKEIAVLSVQEYPVKFKNISDGFQVSIFASNVKAGEKAGENLTENQQKIIDLINHNNKITAYKLAQQIGISQRKIEENIAKLKKLGMIKRIGPAKGGHWKIINNEMD